MRFCQINGGVFGSTGKIMFGISKVVNSLGNKSLCFSPVTISNRFQEPKEKYVKIGTYRSRQFGVFLSRITGFNGCFSCFSTLKMLNKIKEFKPDIIHLHNMHESFVNLPMLFRFIKKYNIKTVWTLHDCWAFTGNCVYFDICGCDKWQTECKNCPQKSLYPKSFFDNSKKMHRLKKKWVQGIKDLTIVTPSEWLKNMAEKSFLGKYPIQVINNGIDLNVFKSTIGDFRKKYALENKKIVLGVSSIWCYRKGTDVFIELSKRLGDEYKIVLVGTDEEIDKTLPENIISIHRTENQEELSKIYSSADVFVNPTREEVFGMVNVEALACGTPVVTFNTGGSPECIDETCGIVVPVNDIAAMQKEIEKVCTEKPFSKEACIKRSKKFDADEKYAETVKLYLDLFSKK